MSEMRVQPQNKIIVDKIPQNVKLPPFPVYPVFAKQGMEDGIPFMFTTKSQAQQEVADKHMDRQTVGVNGKTIESIQTLQQQIQIQKEKENEDKSKLLQSRPQSPIKNPINIGTEQQLQHTIQLRKTYYKGRRVDAMKRFFNHLSPFFKFGPDYFDDQLAIEGHMAELYARNRILADDEDEDWNEKEKKENDLFSEQLAETMRNLNIVKHSLTGTQMFSQSESSTSSQQDKKKQYHNVDAKKKVFSNIPPPSEYLVERVFLLPEERQQNFLAQLPKKFRKVLLLALVRFAETKGNDVIEKQLEIEEEQQRRKQRLEDRARMTIALGVDRESDQLNKNNKQLLKQGNLFNNGIAWQLMPIFEMAKMSFSEAIQAIHILPKGLRMKLEKRHREARLEQRRKKHQRRQSQNKRSPTTGILNDEDKEDDNKEDDNILQELEALKIGRLRPSSADPYLRLFGKGKQPEKIEVKKEDEEQKMRRKKQTRILQNSASIVMIKKDLDQEEEEEEEEKEEEDFALQEQQLQMKQQQLKQQQQQMLKRNKPKSRDSHKSYQSEKLSEKEKQSLINSGDFTINQDGNYEFKKRKVSKRVSNDLRGHQNELEEDNEGYSSRSHVSWIVQQSSDQEIEDETIETMDSKGKINKLIRKKKKLKKKKKKQVDNQKDQKQQKSSEQSLDDKNNKFQYFYQYDDGTNLSEQQIYQAQLERRKLILQKRRDMKRKTKQNDEDKQKGSQDNKLLEDEIDNWDLSLGIKKNKKSKSNLLRSSSLEELDELITEDMDDDDILKIVDAYQKVGYEQVRKLIIKEKKKKMRSLTTKQQLAEINQQQLDEQNNQQQEEEDSESDSLSNYGKIHGKNWKGGISLQLSQLNRNQGDEDIAQDDIDKILNDALGDGQVSEIDSLDEDSTDRSDRSDSLAPDEQQKQQKKRKKKPAFLLDFSLQKDTGDTLKRQRRKPALPKEIQDNNQSATIKQESEFKAIEATEEMDTDRILRLVGEKAQAAERKQEQLEKEEEQELLGKRIKFDEMTEEEQQIFQDYEDMQNGIIRDQNGNIIQPGVDLGMKTKKKGKQVTYHKGKRRGSNTDSKSGLESLDSESNLMVRNNGTLDDVQEEEEDPTMARRKKYSAKQRKEIMAHGRVAARLRQDFKLLSEKGNLDDVQEQEEGDEYRYIQRYMRRSNSCIEIWSPFRHLYTQPYMTEIERAQILGINYRPDSAVPQQAPS
ncbi:MAG: hypothetical protein EZS28_011262, partial [Streblomastix strix]